MSGQPVQSFPVPQLGREVTRSSRAEKGKCPQVEEGTFNNFATGHGGYNTSTNSTHITPSRSVKELNLFNLTDKASDMPGSECWEKPDTAGSNPPSKKMMITRPLGKDDNPVLMTRDQFYELCSRGDKCAEKSQHGTKGEPSSREQTIKLFGKILTITSPAEHRSGKEPMPTILAEREGTMKHSSSKELVSTILAEEGEGTMKHRRGKEPVPSDVIRREEIAKSKANDESEHKRKARSLRWVCNQGQLHKRNINVVREIMMSGSEVDEKKVPSVAAMAMMSRVLNNAPRCEIKKMNGYSVWY